MVTRHLVEELRGTDDFRSGNHNLLMGEGSNKIRRRHTEEEKNAMGEALAAALKPDA